MESIGHHSNIFLCCEHSVVGIIHRRGKWDVEGDGTALDLYSKCPQTYITGRWGDDKGLDYVNVVRKDVIEYAIVDNCQVKRNMYVV